MMATVTNTIDQQSLKQDFTTDLIEASFDALNDIGLNDFGNFTTDLIEASFDVLNDIELDDLESILTIEFAQGLPCDTEFSGW